MILFGFIMPNMSNNNPNTYQTRDLYFASYLHAQKIELIDVHRTSDNRGIFSVFIFSPNDICLQWEAKFYRNEAKVDAKQYSDSIRYLKSIIHKRE